jgi:hypothetical protein
MCIEGIPVEGQTTTHRNMNGGSVTAPPPVTFLSGILPPRLSHRAFIPARQHSARFKSFIILFLLFLKSRNSEIA